MQRALILAVLTGCAVVNHPVVPAAVPPPSGNGWQAVLDGVQVEHEAVISARWAVPRKGLIDLKDPAAADLPHDKMEGTRNIRAIRGLDAGRRGGA